MTEPKPALAPCPICGKLAATAYKPFCSKRCANIDLNRWLNNAYSIAGEPQEDDGGERDFEPSQN